MELNFESVLAEYGSLLSRVATSYEANSALRQELLQEMCLAVWQALNRFEGNSSLKTYVLRVAHNKAVDHVTYHAKQPFQEHFGGSNDDQGTESDSPHKQAQQESQLNQLLNAVRQLPIPQRQVVTLSLEGLNYQEIADVCGLTKNNVGVMLNRAKKVLMQQVQNHE